MGIDVQQPGLLEALRNRATRLAVVSNFDHRLPDILEALEIHHYFESIEIPSRHGCAKPDRAIFEAAAAALGCKPTSLLYVGDDPPERLDAIRALGLRVVDVRARKTPEALEAAMLAEIDDPT